MATLQEDLQCSREVFVFGYAGGQTWACHRGASRLWQGFETMYFHPHNVKHSLQLWSDVESLPQMLPCQETAALPVRSGSTGNHMDLKALLVIYFGW